ncbi:MAG: hypothetical protein US81_C0007G0025 [Parcubacteria group bacterium GW2011_GWE2_38_18]|nr:MAG: hypothetical protein US81_C0007G0025 [Parcubacteria group bacterium GW2011_GWE2_38_18]
MSKKTAIIISPNWRDYAEKYLNDCLDSLAEQTFSGECKYFFVDNESTDESFEYLKEIVENKIRSSEHEIIRIKHNAGFAEGNNQAMKLAIEQGYDYLILFNMDTVIEKSAVAKIIEIAESNEKIGVVQARLMLWTPSGQAEKNKINSLGNSTHFLGFGYCEGYGEKLQATSYKLQVKDIFYPSGAAFLIKAGVIKKIGYFDEEFWMYNEDQDLGWRAWLAGYRCILAPEAIVYHKYEFSRSITKYYWMDRNRLLVILKNYHFLTLLMILPALIIMEFGLFLFALKGGWIKDKIKIYKYFLSINNWRYIIRARQDCQKTRKIKDKEIAKMITGKIWYQEVDDWKLRAINPVFNFYWKVIKSIIIW